MKIYPKIIWMYWDQGADSMPDLTQRCVAQWRKLAPDHNIRLLDNTTILSYLPEEVIPIMAKAKKKSYAAMSDVIRIALLRSHGGIWIDATVWPMSPLDDWLSPTDAGFFAFANPGPDRMLSSWFLAASEQSTIVDHWYREVINYWSSWKLHRRYYWFHDLFAKIHHDFYEVAQLWEDAQDISAKGPHHLAPFKEKFFERATRERQEALLKRNPPVLKLTYKCVNEGYPKDSMIEWLLNIT